MGLIGLTDKQRAYLSELQARDNDPDGKPLTEKMKGALSDLIEKSKCVDLPETAKTYLREWYAGEEKSLHTKQIDKGVMCELECIAYMAQVLEFGVADRNTVQYENGYQTGCPDVVLDTAIVDTKCPWDIESLQSNCDGIDIDYLWQGIAYCILTRRNVFILFYGLMDTDESINFGNEIIYSELPDSERWIAYRIELTDDDLARYEQQIKERVLMCRDYLAQYDKLVKSKMGRVNTVDTNLLK
jgi:hypothetical protein